MSKAFTKEDDGEEALPPYTPPWPPGARNYVTPAGYERLRRERDALVASAAATRETHRRLQLLDVHLEAAEVVAPVEHPDRVQFGVTVTVRGQTERRYTIVGVDEVDVSAGRISWLSPLARALNGAQVGDSVRFHSPRGDEELEVLAIS